jgi:heme oxygenase
VGWLDDREQKQKELDYDHDHGHVHYEEHPQQGDEWWRAFAASGR